LQYRVPTLVVERLAGMIVPTGSLDILDVGCGTGLCAPLLKPFAVRLVGVDLSAGMLAEAAKRELYDELIKADLTAYMAARSSAFDVIVACDTLVYQGRLEETVAAAAAALKPGGLLVLTLERLPDGGTQPYRLAPHGRFGHHADYVLATIARAGLVEGNANAIVPRLECGEPVDGLLVTARAPAFRTNTTSQ
jgi:predicted TPR repeat methyltransferase